MACKDGNRQAPFESIASNQSDFINDEYLPNGMKLNDPWSMKQEALMKFFHYIASQEVSHGIHEAFKFKAVFSSRRKGVLQK